MVKVFHKNVFAMLQKIGIDVSTIKTKQGLESAIDELKQAIDTGKVQQTDILNLLTAYKVYKSDNDPIDKLVKAITPLIKPEQVSNIETLRQFHQGQQVEFTLDVDEDEDIEFINITKDEFIDYMIEHAIYDFHKNVTRKVTHLPTKTLIARIKGNDFVSPTLPEQEVKDFIAKHTKIVPVSKVKIK